MKDLILFIISTAGLSWILCRSKLFTPLRSFLTDSYKDKIEDISAEGMSLILGIKLYFYYFFSSIFSCEGCMGFWAGAVNYILIYKSLDINILSYGFAGSIVSLFIISLINLVARK